MESARTLADQPAASGFAEGIAEARVGATDAVAPARDTAGAFPAVRTGVSYHNVPTVVAAAVPVQIVDATEAVTEILVVRLVALVARESLALHLVPLVYGQKGPRAGH